MRPQRGLARRYTARFRQAAFPWQGRSPHKPSPRIVPAPAPPRARPSPAARAPLPPPPAPRRSAEGSQVEQNPRAGVPRQRQGSPPGAIGLGPAPQGRRAEGVRWGSGPGVPRRCRAARAHPAAPLPSESSSSSSASRARTSSGRDTLSRLRSAMLVRRGRALPSSGCPLSPFVRGWRGAGRRRGRGGWLSPPRGLSRACRGRRAGGRSARGDGARREGMRRFLLSSPLLLLLLRRLLQRGPAMAAPAARPRSLRIGSSPRPAHPPPAAARHRGGGSPWPRPGPGPAVPARLGLAAALALRCRCRDWGWLGTAAVTST